MISVTENIFRSGILQEMMAKGDSGNKGNWDKDLKETEIREVLHFVFSEYSLSLSSNLQCGCVKVPELLLCSQLGNLLPVAQGQCLGRAEQLLWVEKNV